MSGNSDLDVPERTTWAFMSPEAGKQRLMDLGATLGRRINAIVDKGAGLSTSLAESGQAITRSLSLGEAVFRQDEINRTGANMQQLTFALAVSNHTEAMRLKRLVLMGHNHTRQLESRLEEQASAIVSLNESVTELELEASFHREQSTRLRQDLDFNTSLLQRSIAEQRADRLAHQAVLKQQQMLLDRLYTRKIHHDAIVDLILSGASFWAVNLTLVDAPLRVLLALVPRQRLRKWLRQSAKVVLLMYLFSILRRRAQMSGVHNSMGSALAYGKQVAKWLPRVIQDRVLMNATGDETPTTPGKGAANYASNHPFASTPLRADVPSPSKWSPE